MLVWLNWASMVVVMSEPVQPRWTSLLEALVCRTAPVFLMVWRWFAFSFFLFILPKVSVLWKMSEGYRKVFILWCGNLQISPKSSFVVPLYSSHHLSAVLSWVCCAWHSFTAHLDALLCTSQAAVWFCRALQFFAKWPYGQAGQLDCCQFAVCNVGVCELVWEGCKALKCLSDASASFLLQTLHLRQPQEQSTLGECV